MERIPLDKEQLYAYDITIKALQEILEECKGGSESVYRGAMHNQIEFLEKIKKEGW